MTEIDTRVKKNKTLDTFEPSWFDRFIQAMGRLPGPYWLAFVLLGVLIAGLGIIIKAVDPSQTQIGLIPIEMLVIFQTIFVITLMTYLNQNAAKALQTFRTAYRGSEELYSKLGLHISSMPARSINRLTVVFFIIFSLIIFLLVKYIVPMVERGQLSLASYTFSSSPFGFYAIGMGTLLWLVNTIFIYNTIHQLKIINFIYTQHAEIDLFRQQELYAFSRVLAARSIGFVLTAPLWLLLDRGIITLSVNIVFSIIALIIFIVPLVGVHRLLEAQKEALLKQSAQSRGLMIHQLFAHLEQGEQNKAAELKDNLTSVVLAHDEIAGVSTWPWQTNTLRQLTGAVTLPIVIWLIQFVLARILER